ncbi:hypothetical protein U1763_09730 [Sphingomonas sp. LB2R24]|uniref:hypothetical protein n=1 Tax=Sphingomonas sorbitolis TaxID=3096165 RepID=UPI002FCB2F65
MTVIGLSFAAARKILDEYALSSIQGTCFAVGRVLLPSRGLIGVEFHGDCAENKLGVVLVFEVVDAATVFAAVADTAFCVAGEPVTTVMPSVAEAAPVAGVASLPLPLPADHARAGTLERKASMSLRSTSGRFAAVPESSKTLS